MEAWVDVCLICAKRYTSEEKMKEHITSDHGSDDFTKACPEGGSVELVCSCPFCPYETAKSDDLEQHVKVEHANELKTPKKDEGNKSSDHPKAHPQNTRPRIRDLEINTETAASNLHDTCNGATAAYTCPVCGVPTFNSPEELALHVNSHFADDCEAHSTTMDDSSEKTLCMPAPARVDDELLARRLQEEENHSQSCQSKKAAEDLYFQQLQEEHGMGEVHKRMGFRKQALKNMGKRVGERKMSPFEYYNNKLTMIEKLEEGVDDGSTLSFGIIEQLKRYFEHQTKPGSAVWLSPPTDHFGRGPGDSGWGCGYRNIQMIISCLNKLLHFSDHMKHKTEGCVPSIPKLQQMIETAWSEGYDIRGKHQLESKLTGTRKWIGATEVFALLASLGLHMRIIDFPRFSGPSKSHPLLWQWIQDYYREEGNNDVSTRCKCTQRPPLYLQHEGHSRIIVGIVCNQTGHSSGQNNILLFDPGHSRYQIWKKVSRKNSSKKPELNTGLLIKPFSKFTHPQYQIVCVESIASEARMRQQKNVDSLCEKVQ